MSGGLNVPVLKLELEGAKHSLLTVLRERQSELEAMINASFERAVEHIQRQLDDQVYAALSVVMAQAVADAASLASRGLAEELADAMAGQVRDLVRKNMGPKG